MQREKWKKLTPMCEKKYNANTKNYKVALVDQDGIGGCRKFLVCAKQKTLRNFVSCTS